MPELKQQECEACRADAPKVSEEEARELRKEIPEWELAGNKGERRLQRAFNFDDFAQALAFTNKVGELAEQQGHHPELLTGYGHVQVTWYTHKINGLHRNDFIMAAKTDDLYKEVK